MLGEIHSELECEVEGFHMLAGHKTEAEPYYELEDELEALHFGPAFPTFLAFCGVTYRTSGLRLGDK